MREAILFFFECFLVALEALTKLPETLQALNEKRVRELVYSEGLTAGGIGAFLRY